MRGGEDGGRTEDSEARIGDEAKEPAEEEVLEEDLLSEGPEGVSPVAFEKGERAAEGMKRVEADGEGDGDGCEQNGDTDDPEGAEEVGGAQAHRGGAAERGPDDGDEEEGGGDVEEALPRTRRPDDDEDEGVADGEFEEGAALAGDGGVGWIGARREAVGHEESLALLEKWEQSDGMVWWLVMVRL